MNVFGFEHFEKGPLCRIVEHFVGGCAHQSHQPGIDLAQEESLVCERVAFAGSDRAAVAFESRIELLMKLLLRPQSVVLPFAGLRGASDPSVLLGLRAKPARKHADSTGAPVTVNPLQCLEPRAEIS